MQFNVVRLLHKTGKTTTDFFHCDAQSIKAKWQKKPRIVWCFHTSCRCYSFITFIALAAATNIDMELLWVLKPSGLLLSFLFAATLKAQINVNIDDSMLLVILEWIYKKETLLSSHHNYFNKTNYKILLDETITHRYFT